MTVNLDVKAVLDELEEDRRSGRLAEYIAHESWVRYGLDGSGRIMAVDRIGRCWDCALEEKIRQRVDETSTPNTIQLSEQPEHQAQRDSITGIFEHLVREGTLSQYRQGWFYKPKDEKHENAF
jgi:hypothetical protein